MDCDANRKQIPVNNLINDFDIDGHAQRCRLRYGISPSFSVGLSSLRFTSQNEYAEQEYRSEQRMRRENRSLLSKPLSFRLVNQFQKGQ
jgi:hypothetical protein